MSKKTKTSKTPEAPKAKRSRKSPEVAPSAKPETTDAPAANVTPTEATTPKATKTPKTAKEPKAKKASALDLAAEVLKAKGEPMTCKDIMEGVLAKGWTTNGKTPAATLYSAMLREIDGKPGESRFAKTGRGLFALTNA